MKITSYIHQKPGIMKQYIYAIITVCLALLLITACEEDEPEVIPDYVGSWSTSWAYIDEGDTMEVKEIMTLTADTYTDITQLRSYPNGTFIDFYGLKGTFTVSGYTMSIDIKQIGLTTADGEGNPTGNLIYYKEGDPEYFTLVSELGQPDDFDADYSIAGDFMTFLVDWNEDGDFYDAGELTIFTRQ
jgi:hypothetical protein